MKTLKDVIDAVGTRGNTNGKLKSVLKKCNKNLKIEVRTYYLM